MGVRINTRSCSNPTPSCGGSQCIGSSTEEVECDSRGKITTAPRNELSQGDDTRSHVLFTLMFVCGQSRNQQSSHCISLMRTVKSVKVKQNFGDTIHNHKINAMQWKFFGQDRDCG